MTTPSGLDAFLAAIAQEESGGSYAAHNPGGAIGKYQVMPGNVADWTRRALGYSETPAQFQHDPAAQEAVARTILGGYYARYGPAGAAAMWFSGQPDPNSGASDGNTTVRGYVDKVLSFMRNGTGAGTAAGAPSTQSAGLDLTGGLAPAISSVTETIKNLAITAPFVIGGVVLVVLGIGHATGANAKIRAKAHDAADTAKKAAVVAATA